MIVAGIVLYKNHIDRMEQAANIFANSNSEFNQLVYYNDLSALYNILSGVLFGGFLIAEVSYLILLKKEYLKKQIIFSVIIILILFLNVLLQFIKPLIFAPNNFYAFILVIGITLIVIGIREIIIEKTLKKKAENDIAIEK